MNTTLYHKTYQEQLLEYKEQLQILGYNNTTCNLRYHTLKKFFSFLESLGIYELKQIKAHTIDQYYSHIQNKKSLNTGENLKHKTVQDYMRYIKNYLEYSREQGKIKTNPASHLEFKYIFESVERFIFSPSQIQELYLVSDSLEKAILNIGYGCALRVGEMEKINTQDIKLQDKKVIVQCGKNSKRRIVPITTKIKNELQNFIQNHNQENQNALFINTKNRPMREWTFNKMLKEMVVKTNFGKQLPRHELNKISFHSLRHSIATHLLQNGMKLEQVQVFLGHNERQSTTIYTHVNQNQLNQLIDD
jgi:integrase/recombinase XerD